MQHAHWVFAYGSLMWDHPFTPAESRPARIHGWHRSMCLLSQHYRGTPEQPGLVLGLEPGGSCLGLALRIDPRDHHRVWQTLYERELLSNAYRVVDLTARLSDGRPVAAAGFVMRRDHPQYAGAISEDQRVHLIRHGQGRMGTSRDYLANTVARLRALGLPDQRLERLLAQI